jgi:hypothetical protein
VPRYFFDIHDGESHVVDDEGLELEGFEHAQKEAIQTLPEVARDILNSGVKAVVITVRDERGNEVLRAQLNLTVKECGEELGAQSGCTTQ